MAANSAVRVQKHSLSLSDSLRCVMCDFKVYVWVLNDEEDFQRAFDLGATGVMTDFPTKLKDFLDRNGLSKPE